MTRSYRGPGLFFSGIVVLGLCASLPARADTSTWTQCVSELHDGALEQGIEQSTADDVFSRVTELPRVIQADRKQPEFTKTFPEYYRVRVTDSRVTRGRAMLAEHANLLADIKARTGVPPQYLVALWGLETNFGSYFGKLSLPSALTTLACDTRRSKFFTRELYNLIRIIDAGHMDYDELVGSWAGALGHMQFMPSTFLSYAVDASGDGRIDLIGSVEDALTSGGNYLASIGWQAGYRWGREVLLPESFNYRLSDEAQPRTLSEWRELGITDTFGRPVAAVDVGARLLLPSGYTGPAFLVYDNFNVIMKWNRSRSYAISVGRLADRIAGAGKLHTALPDHKIPYQTLLDTQAGLNQLGYDAGKPDGVIGPSTRRAIREFQSAHNQPADGYPTAWLFDTVAEQVMRSKNKGENNHE